MSRKHFVMVAARIKRTLDETANGVNPAAERSVLTFLAWGLAQDFAAENPRFDRARFLKACGLEA